MDGDSTFDVAPFAIKSRVAFVGRGLFLPR